MKNFIKSLWKDESAQGATEYILLLVVVVGVAMMFKTQILKQVNDLLAKLGTDLGGFSANSTQ